PRCTVERQSSRNGAARGARGAQRGGRGLAHRSAGVPAGVHHGRPRGGAPGGGAEAAVTRPDPDSFLSGDGGDVTDPWRRAKRTAGELAYDAIDAMTATRLRTARLARTTRAPLDVLVLGVYRDAALLTHTLSALRSTRHRVRFALGSMGPADGGLREYTVAEHLSGGKFQNLNRVLEAADETPDWTIVVDDDVRL